MGCYLQTPNNLGKAAYLREHYEAETFNGSSLSDVPAGKALICVVENGAFDAAGVAYDEVEFRAFSYPDDRPKHWLLLDKHNALELAPDLAFYIRERRASQDPSA